MTLRLPKISLDTWEMLGWILIFTGLALRIIGSFFP